MPKPSARLYRYKAFIYNVIDGNTVEALVDLGFRMAAQVRLTLAGVQAPARGEPGYLEANEFVRLRIEGRDIEIETLRGTSHCEWPAILHYEGASLNVLLLETGLAQPTNEEEST